MHVEVHIQPVQFPDIPEMPPYLRGKEIDVYFRPGQVFIESQDDPFGDNLSGVSRDYAIGELPSWVREAWF